MIVYQSCIEPANGGIFFAFKEEKYPSAVRAGIENLFGLMGFG